MFHQIYAFSTQSSSQSDYVITESNLYTKEKGYGFVIPKNRLEQEDLQIPEVNSGFDPWYWLESQNFVELSSSPNGIYVNKVDSTLMPDALIPLCFKVNVPCSDNYKVTLTLHNLDHTPHSALLFSGRRRLMSHIEHLAAHTSITRTFLVNVSDIIPRARTLPFNDLTLDLAIVGPQIALTKIEIMSCNAPTLYIGGDSTVTDQNTSYPYHPSHSYCGWGQMLSAFLNEEIAVSNHAHSGLTSGTFRSEGHYKIIEDHIKPGDFFIFQFGHNDQKLPELDAYGGYSKNLTRYIHEIKEKGATPMLVTPLARNTWFANGSYNDLLADYANTCKLIAEKENIALIDLHEFSMTFIKEIGLEKAKAYFFPNDYTHTNDFGGYYMARFIANEMTKLKLGNLSDFIANPLPETNSFTTSKVIPLPTAPEDYEDPNRSIFEVSFTDLESSPYKNEITHLTRLGIISNQDTSFNPTTKATRVEVLNWIIKTVGFVPMNVYNDYYPDVIGHEWYAGTVESAHQNAIVPAALTADGNFHPLQSVTLEEMLCFMLSSYQCRKQLPKQITLDASTIKNTISSNQSNLSHSKTLLEYTTLPNNVSSSNNKVLRLMTSTQLKIAQNIFNLSFDLNSINMLNMITSPLTRQDAAYYISKLHTSLK